MHDIHEAGPEDLDCLEPLWNELYAHQRAHGMLLDIPPNGFALWRQSLVDILGRFAAVWLARQESALSGFIACRLRNVPSYLGGGLAGFISEVYVRDAYRGQGVSRQLLGAVHAWLRARDIRRAELQVLAGNPAALAAYEHMGWKAELVQMVCGLDQEPLKTAL